MLERQGQVVLRLDSFCDHVERQQRGLCTTDLSALTP
jgi:hypothetical protein